MMLPLPLLLLLAAPAVTGPQPPRRTMAYMYCGPDPNQPHPGDPQCDDRTAIALAHASSISTIVLGSVRNIGPKCGLNLA